MIEEIILMIASGLVGGFIIYYFAIRTEDYKFDILKRQQAEKIAELFAKWIKYGEGIKNLSLDEKRDYFEKLNQLTWELAIWIPNGEIIKKIMERLSNKRNADDIRKIILTVRRLILNKKNDNIEWEKIVYFGPAKEGVDVSQTREIIGEFNKVNKALVGIAFDETAKEEVRKSQKLIDEIFKLGYVAGGGSTLKDISNVHVKRDENGNITGYEYDET